MCIRELVFLLLLSCFTSLDRFRSDVSALASKRSRHSRIGFKLLGQFSYQFLQKRSVVAPMAVMTEFIIARTHVFTDNSLVFRIGYATNPPRRTRVLEFARDFSLLCQEIEFSFMGIGHGCAARF